MNTRNTRVISVRLLFVATMLATMHAPVWANDSVYMRVTGVKSEPSLPDWSDSIELTSVDFGGKSVVSRQRNGRASQLTDITIHKEADATTPKLLDLLSKGGAVIKDNDQVGVEFRFYRIVRNQKVEYMRVKLKGAVLRSHRLALESGQERPSSKLTLGYQKIQITYWPYDEGGNRGTPVAAKWDKSTRTASF